MATPTDDDRTLLTVVARMTAKPGKEQELREGPGQPHLVDFAGRLDDLLVGGADGLVITPVTRIA